MDHNTLANLQPGDDGNALALIQSHGQDIRYVVGLGWHYWDGARWCADEKEVRVRSYAKDTVRALYESAKRFSFEQANDAAERIRRAQRSHDAPRVNAMVAMAQSEPAVRAKPEEFDADLWSFNVANGT